MNIKHKRKIAEMLEWGCYFTSEVLFTAAAQFEVWAMLLAKQYIEQDDPSIRQLANRLIEFIDSKYIVFAYNGFINLIGDGMEPNKAFSVITGNEL